jgi:hypothetical protein
VESVKRGCKLSFRFACGILASILAVGCGPSNQTRGVVGAMESGARAVVASPLTSQVVDSSALAAVNSIAIARPSFMYANVQGEISADDASGFIERIAREKMTLKILGAPRGTTSGAGSEGAAPADAVLRTEILRFDQRQGSAFGGEPAVVSFRMNLESRGKHTPMWSAQYFLRQEAVSENLLLLGERVGPSGLGAGWKSAYEVFERGVGVALADLNAQRERQFLAKGAAGLAK